LGNDDRQPRYVTLTEVAAAANVSVATASRALSDNPVISADTRERVRDAAEQLGYLPNRLARSLRTQATSFVGIVVPDIGVEFYARAVQEAQAVFESSDLQVMVADSGRSPAREAAALEMLVAHRVQGALVATAGGAQDWPRIPLVFFDNVVDGEQRINVAPDNSRGIETLLAHLAAHGHRNVAYVGAPTELTSGRERLEAFVTVSARLGMRGSAFLGDELWSAESGKRATIEAFDTAPETSALVAASSTLALGAMQAARERGVSIPEQLALVSFDDSSVAALLDPPLSALERVDGVVGRVAAESLLAAISGSASVLPPIRRIAGRLVSRRSCGCQAVA
jgi:DNA-binding LacI/PurR family transcriptional regulator